MKTIVKYILILLIILSIICIIGVIYYRIWNAGSEFIDNIVCTSGFTFIISIVLYAIFNENNYFKKY